MQNVIYTGLPENSILACDVVEEQNKIYCYRTGSELRFLTKERSKYCWNNLLLTGGSARGIMQGGFNTFSEAIMACADLDVMIFRSQYEVWNYIKNNL